MKSKFRAQPDGAQTSIIYNPYFINSSYTYFYDKHYIGFESSTLTLSIWFRYASLRNKYIILQFFWYFKLEGKLVPALVEELGWPLITQSTICAVRSSQIIVISTEIPIAALWMIYDVESRLWIILSVHCCEVCQPRLLEYESATRRVALLSAWKINFRLPQKSNNESKMTKGKSRLTLLRTDRISSGSWC